MYLMYVIFLVRATLTLIQGWSKYWGPKFGTTLGPLFKRGSSQKSGNAEKFDFVYVSVDTNLRLYDYYQS